MKRLLFTVRKDEFEIQTFRSGGKGGQNQNKRDTGVRIIHRASGARGEARDERTQGRNRALAFQRLTQHPKWRVWLAGEVALHGGKPSPDEVVEAWMNPKNLKVETKVEGRWVPVDGETR